MKFLFHKISVFFFCVLSFCVFSNLIFISFNEKIEGIISEKAFDEKYQQCYFKLNTVDEKIYVKDRTYILNPIDGKFTFYKSKSPIIEFILESIAFISFIFVFLIFMNLIYKQEKIENNEK